MANLLHLSHATIDLAHLVFVDWDAYEDSRCMKKGIKVYLSVGTVFVANDSIYYEDDGNKLALATGRIKTVEQEEKTIRILTVE